MFCEESISKRPLLSNICVPDDRDLSTGSNYTPRNTQCIPVVNPDMSGSPSLILNKTEHFETASEDKPNWASVSGTNPAVCETYNIQLNY
jgi:hypothetical protein